MKMDECIHATMARRSDGSLCIAVGGVSATLCKDSIRLFPTLLLPASRNLASAGDVGMWSMWAFALSLVWERSWKARSMIPDTNRFLAGGCHVRFSFC